MDERMSRREFKRLEAVVRARVARLGPKGVLHGNRGRRPRHRIAEAVRARVVELRREKYGGFNDQHFSEKLAEVEGVQLSRTTVRRILRAAGIGAEQKRRAPQHR